LSDYQRQVIDYFKEIALGFEFGSASPITRKWKAPMKIFVGGVSNAMLNRELNLVVEELNALITDDFKIEIVSDKNASNFFVFFGAPQHFASLYPEDADLANSNSGAYRIYWNDRDEIVGGHLFVSLKRTSIEEQRSVLREELTQSLGLGNDSPLYSESIFQSEFSTPVAYATIDKDVIRLLYHPKMTIGLTAEESEVVLKEILLSEPGI
jgi:hypothetical protein